MRKPVCFSYPAADLLVIAILLCNVFGQAQTAGDIYSTDNVVGKMRYVPAGVFTQGSPTHEPGRHSDENQFSHFLSKNIAVMETAVTRQMWAGLQLVQPSLPDDPSNLSCGPLLDHPVQSVTWYEAVLFANLLSVQNGLTPCYYRDSRLTVPVDPTNYKSGQSFCNFEANGYRLPAEGEREYFARAWTTGFFSIDEPNYSDATFGDCTPGLLPSLETVSWFCSITVCCTKPAGSKNANPWNLKDVHGNVMEWCWDYYGSYPTGNATDFRGARPENMRVIRGGYASFDARFARSANRFCRMPYIAETAIGFRLVRTLNQMPASAVTVTYPAGSESWWVGTAHPINWIATDDINNVSIEYSTNNGSNWLPVVSAAPNNGQYDWAVPNTPSSSCLVRISNAAHPPTSDICAATFSIVPIPAPAISLNRVEVKFYSASGQTSLPSQWLKIDNSGGGTLNWSASPSAGWITVTPSSGSGSQLIKIEANPSGLSPGIYAATLAISDPQASNSPRNIDVDLSISSSAEEPYFTAENYDYAPPPDGWIGHLAFIDFDSDGDKDVIYIDSSAPPFPEPWGNGRVHSLENDGNGDFTDTTNRVFGENNILLGYISKPIMADLNGDGREDLFISDPPYDRCPWGGGQNLIFIQTADGRLKNETESRLPDGIGATDAAAGDIDGDGDLDILGLLQPGLPPFQYAYLLVNDGSGHFSHNTERLPPFLTEAQRLYASGCFLDVDKDGDLDLFLGAASGSIEPRDTILLNDGTGHFTEAPQQALPDRLYSIPSGDDWRAVTADFNADGWPDIAVGVTGEPGQEALQLMLNNGDGTFRDASSNILPQAAINRIPLETGDVNDDGWMDLLFAPVYIYLNQGDAQFIETRNALLPSPPAYFEWSYVAQDLDNDGDTDLLSDNLCFFRKLRPYVTATLLPYPSAPTLNSPADGSTLGTNSPTLMWSPVATAISYEVEVAADSSFSSPVFLKTDIHPTLFNLNALGDNATYYWRVRAYNTRGAGAWSIVRGFFISTVAGDIVADFGAIGLWLWSDGVWGQLTGVDPGGTIAADTDGDNTGEIVVDFGAIGLWLWDDGAWTQLSGVNPDGMIMADTDGDGKDEVVGDFGAVGLWLWDGGVWTLLSGVNADGMIAAAVDGDSADEVVADFGPIGLWVWDGGSWSELSGVNADGLISADTDGDSKDEVVVDFGTVGLWLNDDGAWSELSGVNAQGMVAGDPDADPSDELAVDFGALGLWIWNGGAWTQVSGMNPETLLSANLTTSASSELIVDFGALGIWMWDIGTWSQISTSNPEGMISANLDADPLAEIVVDFSSLGIWVWNGGVWSQLSATNPESIIARKT